MLDYEDVFLRGGNSLNKRKILQVITLSETGGAQKVLYNIVAEISPANFDVTVVCPPGGELIKWLKEKSWVKVIEMPQLCREVSPLKDIVSFGKIYRLIRKERFDIVHCHSSKAGILGRLAAYLAGVKKIVFTVHGWGITPGQSRLKKFIYTYVERLAGYTSTHVVCVSHADLERGLKERLAPASKLKLIYNGMPLPDEKKDYKHETSHILAYSGERELFPGACLSVKSLRAELGLDGDDLLVGTVSRLTTPKTPFFFLEMSRDLLNLNLSSDFHATSERIDKSYYKKPYFVIIGAGPLKKQCQDYIKDNNLQERVFLLGSRDDAARLMADFDVFCLFSSWEGLPLTIIEAMLNSKPVVASDVGGVKELVAEGQTGFLVSPGDRDKAIRVMENLLSDLELRKRMGNAGYKIAAEKFNLERMIEKYKKIYLS